MNSAEHIHYISGVLAEKDAITRSQCVEIIKALVEPYIGGEEPPHFAQVNEKIHLLLDVLDPSRRNGEGEDQ